MIVGIRAVGGTCCWSDNFGVLRTIAIAIQRRRRGLPIAEAYPGTLTCECIGIGIGELFAVHMRRVFYGEVAQNLARVLGLIDGARLQCHGDRSGAVEAGIVEMAAVQDHHGNELGRGATARVRLPLDDRDGAWASFIRSRAGALRLFAALGCERASGECAAGKKREADGEGEKITV